MTSAGLCLRVVREAQPVSSLMFGNAAIGLFQNASANVVVVLGGTRPRSRERGDCHPPARSLTVSLYPIPSVNQPIGRGSLLWLKESARQSTRHPLFGQLSEVLAHFLTNSTGMSGQVNA